MKNDFIKIREDLRPHDLFVPLEDGRYISTSDPREFETMDYDDTTRNDEFNLSILVDGIWTRAMSIDFDFINQ